MFIPSPLFKICSVGSMAVQIAKEMGFTIYATASKKNHDYIRNLAGNAVSISSIPSTELTNSSPSKCLITMMKKFLT